MKNLMKIAGGLLVLVGIIAAINLLHAQEAVQGGVVSLTDTNVDWNAMSDLEVELKAVESVPPMPANSLPSAGTYWSAQHAPGTAEEWPPLPTPLGMGAWSLGDDGVYLLDDLNHAYASPKQSTSAATTSSGMMTTADVDINPADGGDDTNDDSGGGYSPQLSPVEEFGTNLWLEITNLTNNTADFMVSNTIADVEYEIQSRADLVQGNWNSEGFFYGSEITNWTPTSAEATNYPNLFYRIRSWQSSDGSGIPDWWELKYFGTTGVDPYADPDGDGWNNLQEFQNGTDPTVFNTPPSPVFSVTPTANDNGEVISWNPAQGAVTGYTIYRNGSAIATVSSGTFSYTDSTAVNLDDPNDGDYPVYTVQASYSGSSYSSPDEGPFNPRLGVYPAIVRGAQGQYILLVPNIPSEAMTIRFYPQPSGADYPDDFFDIETYNQPINYFMPGSTTNIIDVPVSSFTTNGQYAIPTSLMPLFGTYGSFISCRALGADGSAGAASTIFIANNYFLAESEIQARIPFIDGTEQLKENLAFQLEAADKLGSFSFYVEGANQAASFPQNYAYAGFYFPLDFGSPQYNYAFLHPFKPFEDNYFYRDFVYAFTNLNSDGSLASGAFYSGGVLIPYFPD